jgi:hypothetical protein
VRARYETRSAEDRLLAAEASTDRSAKSSSLATADIDSHQQAFH